ncbi:MAG: hypothetical protein K0U98_06165 [Deltaproteobacteria bacterium]|nr:hypothetical protein [Deltaproteobacteria bacterium]
MSTPAQDLNHLAALATRHQLGSCPLCRQPLKQAHAVTDRKSTSNHGEVLCASGCSFQVRPSAAAFTIRDAPKRSAATSLFPFEA